MANFPKIIRALSLPRTILNGKGFTLIELLVVMTIMGILAALAGGNYLTSLKKGRDTKRKGDIKQIQQAFEQYYGTNQAYYDTNCATTFPAGYFSGIYPPKDPQGSSYDIACSTTDYCACATLEQTGSGNADAPSGSTCNFASGGDYFCVGNLQ